MKTAICSSSVVAFLALPVAALAADWTITGQGEDAIVTDCADCEEDIGIMFQCQGPGMGAKLMIMAQAQESVPSGPLVFSVDGQTFNYRPQNQFFGLVGNVPWINLALSDPLTDALINGETLTVFYNGGGIQYSLEGLYEKLSLFAEACDLGDGIPDGEDTDSASGIGQTQQPLLMQPGLQEPEQPQLVQPGANIGQPELQQPSLGNVPTKQPLLGNNLTTIPVQPDLEPQQPNLTGGEMPPVTFDPELRPVSFPFNTRSGGGKVRAGASIETPKVGSTSEMAPITILEEVPNSNFNGYPWFRIQYSGGVGFQWGGIICRPVNVNIPGTYGECTR